MIIFDQGYSTDVDGRGTRLVFYLKGCNFHCDWCGAPESISALPEKLFYSNRTEIAGRNITIKEITDKSLRCRNFTDGVTFGGGEPTLQADELTETLAILKHENIHSALESNASTSAYRRVINHVDQLFSDLKTLSPELFAARINPDINLLSNVCSNLEFAALNHPDLTIRIPVITGLNDTETEEHKFGIFLSELQQKGGKFKVQLLRQHHLAEVKYEALKRTYSCRGITVPSDGIMENFKKILKYYQLEVI